MKNCKTNPYTLASVSVLSALASVLMFFSVSVPLVPSFLKFDLSELPALIAAFTVGPLAGVAVCLVKNIVNVFFTTTVSESTTFFGHRICIAAGLIWAAKQPAGRAARRLGRVVHELAGLPLNYFIVIRFMLNCLCRWKSSAVSGNRLPPKA